MSLWLTNFPTVFIDLMNHIFKPYLDSFMINFVNNSMVYFRSREEHERHLRTMLHSLRNIKIYAKFSKCEFWIKSVVFLRNVVSKYGIMVD